MRTLIVTFALVMMALTSNAQTTGSQANRGGTVVIILEGFTSQTVELDAPSNSIKVVTILDENGNTMYLTAFTGDLLTISSLNLKKAPDAMIIKSKDLETTTKF